MKNFEQNFSTEDPQIQLRYTVAEFMGVTYEAVGRWHINRIREDGAIDAYLPLDEIQVAGVPTDPGNVNYLVRLLDERTKEVGGSGQRDPVVIGHVPGEGLYMLDGFHRHEAQTIREQTHLHATVEIGLTYEQVVNRRLEYARVHTEVEFARQVEWMQSVWDRTPWCTQIPNVLTAFRAFQEDYALYRTQDVPLIDALSDTEYDQICQWVSARSKEWGYTAAEIRKNLARVESFDKGMMHLVWQKNGVPPAGRIGIQHVELLSKVYGGEFDLQQAVVKIIIENELTVAQAEELVRILEQGNPVYATDIDLIARDIDFLALKLIKAKKASQKKNGRHYNPSSLDREALGNLSVSDALASIRVQLPRIADEIISGNPSKEDVDHALEISLTLTEAVAQLSLKKPQSDR